MSKDQTVTTWALVGTTALGAAGWVTSTMRDRRTADAGLVTAASELVDRLMVEINLVRTDLSAVRVEAMTAKVEAEALRTEVEHCKQQHALVAAELERLKS